MADEAGTVTFRVLLQDLASQAINKVKESLGTLGSTATTTKTPVSNVGKELDTLSSKATAAKSPLSGLATEMSNIGKMAVGMALGNIVTGLLQNLMGSVRGVFDAAAEAEQIAKATEAVLISTKGVAGMTKAAVGELATAYSKVTPYEDEAVQGAENLLLTFTNIGQNIFPQVTETVLNMSTALKQGLKESAIQVGKALQDPILGATALRRVGVALTDQQEEQIKKFVQSGDVLSAQKIILAELETEFGGMARAAGEGTGKLAILHTQLGNVAEAIGGPLIAVLTLLAGKVTPIITEFAEWLPQALRMLASLFQPVIEAIRSFLTTALTPLVELIRTHLIPILIATGIVIASVLVPAFLSLLGAALGAIAGIIGALLPILIPIALIAGAIVLLKTAWEANLGGIQQIVSTIINNVINLLGDLLDWWNSIWPKISVTLNKALTEIQNTIRTVLTRIGEFWKAHGQQVMEILTIAWSIIYGIFLSNLALIGDYIGTWLAILTGDWGRAWELFSRIIAKALIIAVTVVQLGGDAIIKIFSAVTKDIRAGFVELTNMADKLQIKGGVVEDLRAIGNWDTRATVQNWDAFTNSVKASINALLGVNTTLEQTGTASIVPKGSKDIREWLASLKWPELAFPELKAGLGEWLPKVFDAVSDSAGAAKTAMSAALDAAKEKAGELKTALSAAKDQLSLLAKTPVLGEGKLDQAKFDLQQRINALKLQEVQIKLRFAPKEAPGKLLKPIEDELKQLGLAAEKLDLQGKLKYDPLHRQIDALANPQKESPFYMIIQGIKDQRTQIDLLTPQLAIAELAVKGLEIAYKNLAAAAKGATVAMGGKAPSQSGLEEFGGGGTVPGPLGAPLLIIAHGGEEITSGRSGGSGAINLTYSPTINVKGEGQGNLLTQLEAILAEQAQKMRFDLRVALQQGVR